MTIEELKAIPFHFVCSAAWEDEHTLTYETEGGGNQGGGTTGGELEG